MTKSVFAALSLMAAVLPAAALAQTATPAASSAPGSGPASAPATVRTGGAAATLPNSFDNPGARAPAAPPPPVSSTPSSPAVVAAAETALKTTIAALQAGTPNYDDMSPELATKVRELAGQIGPLVQGFGTLQTVAHVGTENGAELFLVTFDKQATQWIIAQDPQHKIRALLFRLAQPAAAAPAA